MPQTGWKVTNQHEDVDLGPDRTPVRGWRVSFVTKAGHTGSIFIEASRYNLNNVKAEIGPLAYQLDLVGSAEV